MNVNKKKYLPTNDVIFTNLFGLPGNERFLQNFLSGILQKEITSIKLGEESKLLKKHISEKLGILDVRAVLPDGTNVDVEMQNIDYSDMDKRMTFYGSKLYAQRIHEGEPYSTLTPVICIAILNFNFFHDILQYHTIWKMTEQNNFNYTMNEIVYHFIELPKFFAQEINLDDTLSQWLIFIDHTRKEMLEQVKDKNVYVKEAEAAYNSLTEEDEIRIWAEAEEKRKRDYANLLYHVKKETEENKKRAEENKKNAEENKKNAEKNKKNAEENKKNAEENKKNAEELKKERQKIEKRGEKISKIQITQKLLSMNMQLKQISEITGLSEQEIKKLKD